MFSEQHIKAKQFHFKISFFFRLLGKIKVKKNVGRYLAVRFSIKPGDQTDETETPNLINKAGLAKY